MSVWPPPSVVIRSPVMVMPKPKWLHPPLTYISGYLNVTNSVTSAGMPSPIVELDVKSPVGRVDVTGPAVAGVDEAEAGVDAAATARRCNVIVDEPERTIS